MLALVICTFTAADVSPLVNAFEADALIDSGCPMTDAFWVAMAPEPRATKMLDALAEVCERTQHPDVVRGTLNELSWSLLDATLRTAPHGALLRAGGMAKPHGDSLRAAHRRVLEAVQDHAGVIES